MVIIGKKYVNFLIIEPFKKYIINFIVKLILNSKLEGGH